MLMLQVKDTLILKQMLLPVYLNINLFKLIPCMMTGCIRLIFSMIFFSMLQCFPLAQCLFLNEISAILHFPTQQSTLTQTLKILNNLLVEWLCESCPFLSNMPVWLWKRELLSFWHFMMINKGCLKNFPPSLQLLTSITADYKVIDLLYSAAP